MYSKSIKTYNYLIRFILSMHQQNYKFKKKTLYKFKRNLLQQTINQKFKTISLEERFYNSFNPNGSEHLDFTSSSFEARRFYTRQLPILCLNRCSNFICVSEVPLSRLAHKHTCELRRNGFNHRNCQCQHVCALEKLL